MNRLAVVPALLSGLLLAVAPAGAAVPATPVGDVCAQLSPSAAPCVGAGKVEQDAPADRQAQVDAYRASWVHRTAAFQERLGDPVPLDDAQWLGTHNSFNAAADGPTPSHLDSNQQLTLAQQLDSDVRALELDLHELPRPGADGTTTSVVVCHGRGPDEANTGCTAEPPLTQVLPEITGWLDAHPDAVLLLYLEDELQSASGYRAAIAALDAGLRRPDGSSRLYRPAAPASTATGCRQLPLSLTRSAVRAAGAQIVAVGACAAGWAADVFGWDQVHVESGSTPGYRPAPACDATYGPGVYASRLVRYYEDSTFVSAAVDPTSSPADAQAERLTPERTADMVRCGVNLFGFDQLLPADGRLAASIWSWADGRPQAGTAGRCTIQRPADGRWDTAACAGRRPAACARADGTWTVTRAVPIAGATAACRARSATFRVPRTGEQNERARTAGSGPPAWLAYRVPAGR
jgi:hypothetical protein